MRLESRGAIRAVQLAGDSCLCNQVRGVSLHAAERYQRWDAEDGTIGTGRDSRPRAWGFCLRDKQRVVGVVGGTVGLVANGYGAAGNEVRRQTWYDRKLKASSSGRRWGGADAAEWAAVVCRSSVGW